MKTTRLVFASLMAMAFVACEKAPVVDEVKSDECKLTSFTISLGSTTLNGFVNQADKTVEISYMPNELEQLTSATAVAVISDKATITPDPASPIDYTVEGGVRFTVTAEDETTKSEYLIYLASAEFSIQTEKVWSKTYGELGLDPTASNMCGIAFTGRNHFACSNKNVYDLSGNKVGTLNIDGITGMDVHSGQLGAMSNDNNGVLVALTLFNGQLVDGNTGIITETYAWKDGWDKKPTLIYRMEAECNYMSVSGDIESDFILTFRTGAGNPQMHHVLSFKDGIFFNADGSSAAVWAGPFIQHPGNDGNWGQLLSFFTGNVEDGFVCWDSVSAAEMGDSGNSSSAVYLYNEGLSAFMAGNATEVALKGNVTWTEWESEGRWYNYGNFSTGHVRAFVYNGQKYVVVCSASWPNTWITIQKATDLIEDDEDTEDIDESRQNYLLTTDIVAGAASCYPCSAYVYDPVSGTGHIVYLAQSSVAVAYDIKTTRL